MRKKLKSVFITLMVMLVGAMTFSPVIFAANELHVEIPVTVSLSGTLPDTAGQFIVKLSASNESIPMPEGSSNGVYTMVISGADTVSFPVISFSKVGVYEYTIAQETGTDSICTYDASVYHLSVYVTNADDGGLESTTVLYKDTENDKLDQAQFSNKYPSANDPSPTNPPKKHHHSGSSGNDSVTASPVQALNLLSPQTGDSAAPILWGGLAVIALAVLIITAMVQKRRRDEI